MTKSQGFWRVSTSYYKPGKRQLAAKVALAPGESPPRAAKANLAVHLGLFIQSRRFVMAARKPFFRAYDGWSYAQIRIGTKRKQVKLVKGADHEEDACQ
jgi:hypothetical protein